MRLPKKGILDKYNQPIKETYIELKDIPFPELYIDREWEHDQKAYVRTIKKIESMVRQSFEYKRYIQYLKEALDINSCFFLSKNIIGKGKSFKIELHHGPLTLYDITNIIFNKYFGLNSRIKNPTFFKVANEVLLKHYELKIGLIPLSITAHELIHKGEVFVPLNHYFGDFYKFIEEYNQYIPEEVRSILATQERLTVEWNNTKQQPSVFNKNFTYLNIEGVDFPKSLKDNYEIIRKES